MRSARNFHPQWGYLAPAPSFLRGARIVLVATVVGATAGAAVVVSLLQRPEADADNSIAAHALVTSAPVSATAGTRRSPAPIAAAPLSASPGSTLANDSATSAAAHGSAASSAAPAQSVAAVPSTNPTIEAAPLADAEAAGTAESKAAVPAKRFAGRRHRTASTAYRRWQGDDAWRRRRWRDNGFSPSLRLFSSRIGSSDYPN